MNKIREILRSADKPKMCQGLIYIIVAIVFAVVVLVPMLGCSPSGDVVVGGGETDVSGVAESEATSELHAGNMRESQREFEDWKARQDARFNFPDYLNEVEKDAIKDIIKEIEWRARTGRGEVVLRIENPPRWTESVRKYFENLGYVLEQRGEDEIGQELWAIIWDEELIGFDDDTEEQE